MKNDKTKKGNKMVIIFCIIFWVFGFGYFIYDEVVYKNKDIITIIPLFLMLLVGYGIYFLLKKGWSIITIKILILVVAAITIFFGEFLGG